MFWLTANFIQLITQLIPPFLRGQKHLSILSSFVTPVQKIHDDTLYQMQHDGRTIYLEKVLNEWFNVVGYDPQYHEATKLVYIDDVIQDEKLYVFQDLETEVTFLEDEPDTTDDVFLDSDYESVGSFSFIIFIPNTFVFDELKVRALVDKYRYIGKKYTIQTYSL